jgi:VWFA-related protein
MRYPALAIAAAALAFAQERTPTFRTTTRLVELSVIALDRKGGAVTDLRMDDFEVTEKGRRRPLAFFRHEGASWAAEQPAQPLPAGIFTNRTEFTSGPPRNITALLIDELNTVPTDAVRVRSQVTRYLKALTPETRVAVYHMSARLRVLHDFTDDIESLRERVRKSTLTMPLQHEADMERAAAEAEQFVNMFAGDPQMQAMMAEMLQAQLETESIANALVRRRRMEMTLDHLEALGRHLAGIPGRKNLVWISGGISILSLTGSMGFGPRGSFESYEQKIRGTAQRLAQHGIALYIVDARGLAPPMGFDAGSAGALPPPGRGRFEQVTTAARISADPHPAGSIMAEITGGRYLYNTNDMLEGFKRAASDLRGSYTLGFYISEEPDSKWHGIKVRVKRSGVEVTHRQGYLAETPADKPVEWTNADIAAVATNPIGSSAVLLTAQAAPAPDAEPGTIRLGLRIEVDRLHFRDQGEVRSAEMEIVRADRTATGVHIERDRGTLQVKVKDWEQARARGLAYAAQWKPKPGVIASRLIVRDRLTGLYGTLDVPLKGDLAPPPAKP